ncbi:hypothetical protein PIB30_098130 [Stylosanthes scabra]|uniref:Cystatin domain-containing protein n=1 Tax=Stylosanthes scabra TaxID=79078 RepID=A0ABU6UVC7_9FABA|nr:hypothetical protein [Stylosanthes scabra]
MRTSCLIIIAMLFLFCFDPSYSATQQAGSESLMSKRIPVDLDVKEPEVIEIANFAVSEHNKRSNPPYLKLSEILSCQKLYHAFGDATYTFELLAHDGVSTNKYMARVCHRTRLSIAYESKDSCGIGCQRARGDWDSEFFSE